MLINANQKEELRIALVDGQKLYDLNIENTVNKKKKLNIYKGIITKIEPSLEAVFVDYGSKKHGFLPFKEISEEYIINKNNKNINNLYVGQKIVVQINKEQRKNKGAFLTTFVSLVGNYLILMPNNFNLEGISRKIEGHNRLKIKKILPHLKIPKNMGVIIRTSGIGKSIKIFKWDLAIRLKYWKYIQKKVKNKNAPCLIHQENNILTRIFKDYLYYDIKQIIIDNKKIYTLSKNYLNKLGKKNFYKEIKYYDKKIPLFNYYQIESQILSAYKKEIRLPSGGSIIIETTEALTTIDINSSKYTKETDIEKTALNTNLEAIEEITKQLRLRNISGLIVIDCIDMSSTKNKKIVKKKIQKKTKKDKAKIKIGSISKFGLLEMSRQRLHYSLQESCYHKCLKCQGIGIIRNIESLSLSILRKLENILLKKNIKEIDLNTSLKVTLYLLNKKRKYLYQIEKNFKTKININYSKKIKDSNFLIKIKKC